MTLIPNPEYQTAPLDGVAIDAAGNNLPEMATMLAFGRILPPRFKKMADVTLEEVPSHIPKPTEK